MRHRDGNRHQHTEDKVGKSFFSFQTISCADSENMSEIGQIYGAAEHIFFTAAFRMLFFSLKTLKIRVIRA